MAKCWKCGKSGAFLTLGKSGLCVNCLEDAADGAIKIISMIKSGGNQRKKALELLDAEAAQEMAEKASKMLQHSKFRCWDSTVHASAAQIERIRKSASIKILDYDPMTETARVQGSGKEPYVTSFTSCSCGDFISRRLPCKHMYRLAADFGGIDFLKFVD